MYSELAWVLVYSGTQVQPQIILDPDYLSVSFGYDLIKQSWLDLSFVVYFGNIKLKKTGLYMFGSGTM